MFAKRFSPSAFRRDARALFRRDTRGAIVVEFAILAPIFLIIVIGMIDFSRLFWIKSTMQFAVEQTARYAMVNADAATADLEAYAEARGATVNGVTYSAATSSSGGINFRTITATYTFSFMLPIVPIGDITLSAKSATPVSSS